MWVRTQDKEFLMKVDNINLGLDVDTNEPTRIFTFVDGTVTSFTLGTYNSKERALKVLDEMQSYLENNYLSISDMPQHNNSWVDYCPRYITRTTKTVYQMPEE